MKYFRKARAHEKFSVALNADKEKYLNYETSINGDLTGKVCVRCHDSDVLNSFGITKVFNISGSDGKGRVTFPEIITRKDNANLRLLVDDEGQRLAITAGSISSVDR